MKGKRKSSESEMQEMSGEQQYDKFETSQKAGKWERDVQEGKWEMYSNNKLIVHCAQMQSKCVTLK